MSLKTLIKRFLPGLVVDTVRRRPSEISSQHYLRSGRVPWSPGYSVYKTQLIVSVLKDEALMTAFQCGESLPPGYGVGVDERCVEYPWLLTHLRAGKELLLDAGAILNHGFILDHRILKEKVIHMISLAPEAQCFWQKGISYLFSDLREMPIRDAYYDTIACLSTLEHVGCDNTLYTQNQAYHENRPGDFVFVMKEFRRVLNDGGSLLITVPFGVYRHFGTFQEFDRKLLSHAIEAFGHASDVTETFYRYTAQGWQLSNAQDCADCEYVEWVMKRPEERPPKFPCQPDGAAAARAVACVRIVKA